MRPSRKIIPQELLPAFDMLAEKENAARREFIAAKSALHYCVNDLCLAKATNGSRCASHYEKVNGKAKAAIAKGNCGYCLFRPIDKQRSRHKCTVCLDVNKIKQNKRNAEKSMLAKNIDPFKDWVYSHQADIAKYPEQFVAISLMDGIVASAETQEKLDAKLYKFGRRRRNDFFISHTKMLEGKQ